MKLMRNMLTAVAFLALAGGSAVAQDGMPQFTMSYFAGGCPSGWAASDGTNGRFLLPSMQGGGAGMYRGLALGSQEEPSHVHQLATGSVSVDSRNFVLVGGCCNESLAHAGSHAMTGSTEETTGGLPYIQFMACTKTGSAEGEDPPSGLMTFYLLPSCPSGWEEVTTAKGRYLVGLPSNGAAGASFGGPSLQPGEVRTHTHQMSGDINLPDKSIVGASGCCAGGYAKSGNSSFTGQTQVDTQGGATPYDSAVQAPYYTATLCRKS